ncbi:hypothetical protein [Thermococcus sp.]
MRKLLAVVLLGAILIASGCIGSGTGLTEKKVLNAIESIKTAHYAENYTMKMYFRVPAENTTVNLTARYHISALLSRVNHTVMGNITGWTHYQGINVTFKWPFYVLGNQTFLKVDGEWYNATNNDDVHSGSFNLRAIERILETHNVTITPVDGGYQFKLNMTYMEFVNATGRAGFISKITANTNATIKTNEGWVLVKLRGDGMPYYMEVYFNLIIDIPQPFLNKTVTVHMLVHDQEAISHINEPLHIKKPEGIEKAKRFEEVFG